MGGSVGSDHPDDLSIAGSLDEDDERRPPFPPERLSDCMRQALDSRYNTMMSAVAREQGAVWVKKHASEVDKAEYLLAKEFAFEYPDDTPGWALKLADAYYASGRGGVDPIIDDVFRSETHNAKLDAANDPKLQVSGA